MKLALPIFVVAVFVAAAVQSIRGRGRWSPPARSAAPSYLWLVVAALVGGLLVAWLLNPRPAGMRIRVDMTVERGDSVELYLNDMGREPLRASISPNVRTAYEFDVEESRIDLLRIDPTNTALAKVQLHGVTILDGEERIAHWEPAEIRTWTIGDLREVAFETTAISFVSASADPMLSQQVAVFAPARKDWLRPLAETVRSPDFLTLLLVAAFLAFLLAGVSNGQGRGDAVAVALVVALAFPAAAGIARLGGSPPAVDQAVGMASYEGYPKARDFRAAGAVLLVAVAAGWLSTRFGRDDSEAAHAATAMSEPRWRRRTIVTGVVLLAVALREPNLQATLNDASSELVRPVGFDGTVHTAWNYMAHRGFLPLRDYWYPYGGYYLSALPAPWGWLTDWFQSAAILVFLFFGLFLATGRRALAALALFALVLIPVSLGAFAGWYRYLLAIELLLCFVGLEGAARPTRTTAVSVGLLAGVAFFFEPVQLIYAIAAFAVVALATGFERSGATGVSPPRAAFAALGRAASKLGPPVALGVAVVLVFLSARGMFPGFLDFHASLGAQAAYGSMPSDVASWVRPLLGPDSLFLALFMLAAISTRVVFAPGASGREPRLALVATSVAGVLVSQKQVMRPHMMPQLLVYAFVGILLYAALAWPRRNLLQTAVAGLFVGALLSLALARADEWVGRLARTPKRTSRNFDILVHRREEMRRIMATRYSPERLAGLGDEAAVVERLRRRPEWRPDDALYFLGTNPLLYLVAGQRTPYHVSTYNNSPLHEQRRTVAWLEATRPPFVLWDPEDRSFDGVPHEVRLPLVYRYVVDHYVPVESVGRFQVLVADSNPPPEVAEYWRSRLAEALDLRQVLRLSGQTAPPQCRSDRCEEALLIEAAPAASSHVASLVVRGAGASEWRIRFDLDPSRRSYVVATSRLWFWGLAAQVGVPTVASETPGVTVRLERRALDPDLLF